MSEEFASPSRSVDQQKLVDYWQSKCQDGRLPTRNDINPTEIPDLVPFLLFLHIEHVDASLRIQYGMTGGQGVRLASREVTGRWIDELYSSDVVAEFGRFSEEAWETKGPVLWSNHMLAPGREHIEISFLACPLSEDGEQLTGLVLVVDHLNADPE